MVRRELAPLLRFPEAAAAGREHHRRRVDLVLTAARAPPAPPRGQGLQSRIRERRAGPRLPGLAQRLRDRVPGPVADLQQPAARRAAAAREPVAPDGRLAVWARGIVAGELDAELLEPVDRSGRLGSQDLHEPRARRLMRTLPDVLRVELRRVVLAEGGLDPAL